MVVVSPTLIEHRCLFRFDVSQNETAILRNRGESTLLLPVKELEISVGPLD